MGRKHRYVLSVVLLVLLMLLMSAMVMGCGDTPEDSPREPRVANLGKADLPGSCKAPDGTLYCGKKSPDGCYCDAVCTKYNDCCADKVQLCDSTPPPSPSCKAPDGTTYCGNKSPAGCYCDAVCTKYNDCCPDKVQVCDAPPPPPHWTDGLPSGAIDLTYTVTDTSCTKKSCGFELKNINGKYMYVHTCKDAGTTQVTRKHRLVGTNDKQPGSLGVLADLANGIKIYKGEDTISGTSKSKIKEDGSWRARGYTYDKYGYTQIREIHELTIQGMSMSGKTTLKDFAWFEGVGFGVSSIVECANITGDAS